MDDELKGHCKNLRARANAAEQKWRAAHGIDGKLRTKKSRRTPKPKHKPEHGEIRRREQRNERRMLARPILKGV
jgi:hypothetical protein